MADEEGLEEIAESVGGSSGGGFPTWAIWLIVAAVVIIAIVVVVVVLFVVDTAPPNQEPTIGSLVPTSASVAPSGSTTITCTATDADGDTLTYTWTTTGGTVSGTGSSVTWMAPAAEGTYSIGVTVDDGKGGSSTRDISVTVAQVNSPPSITSVTPGSATVPPGGSTSVTCTATDPDGDTLTYSWQASLGTISGSGSSVTWDAPMTEGIYSIQCDVEDGRGGNDHQSTSVEVAVVVTAGSINVQSSPAGASVFLDGVDTHNITPYTITNVPAGPHTVLLRKANYKDEQQVVVVTAGGTEYINWALTYTAPVTITLQPDGTGGKDTFVWTDFSSNNYGINNALYAGVETPTTDITRSFIEFDLSGIPSTSIVNYARFYLYYWGDGPSATAGDVGVYRITESWDEGSVTWDDQPNAVASPAAIKTIPLYPGSVVSQQWDLDDLVQGWISGVFTNNGMMLRDANEGTAEDHKYFYSSDHGTASQRPKLTIQYYDPVP